MINKYNKNIELEKLCMLYVVCLAGMTCAEAVNYTPENVSASHCFEVPGNDVEAVSADFAALIYSLNISGWRR